jgi:GNAT superfamily N-acetyltransferase
VDQVRSWFEYNPPGRIQLRLVAVDENEAVTGYGGLVHEASARPGRFIVWTIVDPARRRRGIGAALWNALSASLQEHGATRLAGDVLDDDGPSLEFARRRGFVVDRHLFESTLDLAAFDEAPYLPAIAALEAAGIRFCSLADFPDTPEVRRRHYDLNVENVLDIPGADAGLMWGLADFEHFIIGAPWFRRDGQLLAVDGEAWAGMAAVSLDPESQSAYNEHTGVRSAYRGRKIAQALKVMAVRYARLHGARRLHTDNDSLNEPILAINRKMGYQPRPGKYRIVREAG